MQTEKHIRLVPLRNNSWGSVQSTLVKFTTNALI